METGRGVSFFPIAFHSARKQYAEMILLKNFFVNATEEIDVIPIIHEINRSVFEAQVPQGLAVVIVPAPGAALAIIEPIPDIIEQLKAAIRMFPGLGVLAKTRRKEEINVFSRVGSAMMEKSLAIPIKDGKLLLSPREEVVLVDLDDTGLRREFCVQITGEAPQQPQQQQQARGKR